MRMSVIVPTLERPEELSRCLAGLRAQTQVPYEVIVVLNTLDTISGPALARMETGGLPIRFAYVDTIGVVAAQRCALRIAAGDCVAFLDDDAVPPPRWIEQLATHLEADETIGGLGGRILNIVDGQPTARSFGGGRVTSIDLMGRLRSKLHDIPTRRVVMQVDFLPGSNMCYRRRLLSDIDVRVDCGMAPSEELEIAFAIKRQGYRVVYDSDIVVTHYPAPRSGLVTDRSDRHRRFYEASYVNTFVLLKNLRGPRRMIYGVLTFLIGTKSYPGVLMFPVIYLWGSVSWAEWIASLRGRVMAVRTYRQSSK